MLTVGRRVTGDQSVGSLQRGDTFQFDGNYLLIPYQQEGIRIENMPCGVICVNLDTSTLVWVSAGQLVHNIELLVTERHDED